MAARWFGVAGWFNSKRTFAVVDFGIGRKQNRATVSVLGMLGISPQATKKHSIALPATRCAISMWQAAGLAKRRRFFAAF